MKKGKKDKNQQQKTATVNVPKAVGISKIGKKVIYAGLGVLLVGYFVLTKTDPAGQNWASVISPFLILGGYALIGIGIVVPDRKNASPQL